MSNMNDHDYDDEGDYYVEEDSHRRIPRWIPVAVVASALAGFVSLAWFATSDSDNRVELEEIPTVTADPSPLRVEPENPGGMEVPNQDKEVFEAMNGEGSSGSDEAVVPRAEMPSETTSTTTAAPSEQVAERANIMAENKEAEKKLESLAPVGQPAATAQKVEAPKPAPVQPATQAAPVTQTAPTTTTQATSPEPAKAAVSSGNQKIQIGAFRSEQEAVNAWKKTLKANSGVLSQKLFTVQKAEIEGKGVFYRLHVSGFASASEAGSACVALKQNSVPCFVVR